MHKQVYIYMACHQTSCKAHLEHFCKVLIFPQMAHEGSGIGNGPPLVHVNQFILLCRDKGDCLHVSMYVSMSMQICYVQGSCVLVLIGYIDLASITVKDSMQSTWVWTAEGAKAIWLRYLSDKVPRAIGDATPEGTGFIPP